MGAKKIKKPEVHAVFDEESLRRQAGAAEFERAEQEIFDAASRIKETQRFISTEKLDDIEHQFGQLLETGLFETKLKALCAGTARLVWTHNPLDPGNCSFLGLPPSTVIQHVNIELPDGGLKWVASYVSTALIGEYTLILMKKQRLPSPRTHLSARDFPSYEKIIRADGIEDYVFNGPTPLETYIETPDGKIPGWREVLYRCIEAGLVTLGRAEEAFGASDRASWAAKTGKQRLALEI